MYFLTEFDWGKHVFVNHDWDLGHKVDLLRNVTMSRLMFSANGLIYSGTKYKHEGDETNTDECEIICKVVNA